MIKTSPKMNEFVKSLLEMSDDPVQQYTLQRLKELEVDKETLKDKIESYEKLTQKL